MLKLYTAKRKNYQPIDPTDYPGKNDNMPFNWWYDETYLSNNFSLNLDGYDELTAKEKKLVKIFPVAAFILYKNKETAFLFTQLAFPNVLNAHNNKADAFRYAFFNAINTRDVITSVIHAKIIVKLFSDAHESEVSTNLLIEKEMDIHNNQIGISLCENCLPLIDSNDEIKIDIMLKLLNGELNHIWPLNIDNTILINSQIFPTNQH